MTFKTLQDVERIVLLGKPLEVVESFLLSYRTGVAMQPLLDAEERYAKLVATEDVDDVEPVLDGATGEVIEEGYSPNEVRDAEIKELDTLYPYLEEPNQVPYTIEYEDIDGNIIKEVKFYPIPTVEQRRPTVEPIPMEESTGKYIRTTKGTERNKKLKDMTYDYGDGRVIQIRPPQFAPDESNIRNAMEMMIRVGVTTANWYMADNLPYPVTVEDLRKALDSAQDQGAAIWAEFLGNV